MIQTKDLEVGLHVVTNSGMKGVIVEWEFPEPFTLVFQTMPAKRVIPPPHILINTSNMKDVITWGESSSRLNVDMDYYDENRYEPKTRY